MSKPSLVVIKKVGDYLQYLEDWNLLLEDISNRIEQVVPPALPHPPKKKLRREKQKATSQQRIDSYMSNIYLRRMRASGQCERGTSEQGLFKRYKVKSRKQRMESRSKLRKKAIRSRSNSNFFSERDIKSVRPFLNLAFT